MHTKPSVVVFSPFYIPYGASRRVLRGKTCRTYLAGDYVQHRPQEAARPDLGGGGVGDVARAANVRIRTTHAQHGRTCIIYGCTLFLVRGRARFSEPPKMDPKTMYSPFFYTLDLVLIATFPRNRCLIRSRSSFFVSL